jgi:hypothetical protein
MRKGKVLKSVFVLKAEKKMNMFSCQSEPSMMTILSMLKKLFLSSNDNSAK